MAITRRRFLSTLVVSAGTLSMTGITGCSDGGGSSGDGGSSGPIITPAMFPQSVVSGDPKPDSVILWTRLEDSSLNGSDAELVLQVSSSEDFSDLIVDDFVTALAAHDHCVKVRVTGLESRRFYYYRFVYTQNGTSMTTRTGRTKTAPAPDADVNVRFAYCSCQDFIGKFYNTYITLVNEDLDFIIHLGDYVYETTGDSSFQNTDGERTIEFSNPEEALAVVQGSSSFLAANSLSNYRDLYKAVRTDPMMQAVHERFPFICTWDDHEFSDDSWQANGTYLDEGASELSADRKRRAEQVFFEFTPIDQEQLMASSSLTGGTITVSEEQLFPNTRIFRDFQFGQHLQLFMSDYRTFRPDHLINESAWPEQIALDQDNLVSLSADNPNFDLSRYASYIDLRESPYNGIVSELQISLAEQYVTALTEAGFENNATTQQRANDLATTALAGLASAEGVNELIQAATERLNQQGSPVPAALTQIDQATIDGLPRGVSYGLLGKRSLFADVGARYFVIKDNYDLFARYMYDTLGQQDTQRAYGDTQLQWLTNGINSSTKTWKVLGSSVSFSPLVLNFADPSLAAFVPDAFRWQFYLNVDHWDGFPDEKQALLNGVLGENGVITIAGDIHANYVSEHPVTGTGNRVFDFTGPSVSSGTFGSFIQDAAEGDPTLAQMAPLVPLIDSFLLSGSPSSETASSLVHSNSFEHGVVIMTASSEQLGVDYFTFPDQNEAGAELVNQNLYNTPSVLLDALTLTQFVVRNGELEVVS